MPNRHHLLPSSLRSHRGHDHLWRTTSIAGTASTALAARLFCSTAPFRVPSAPAFSAHARWRHPGVLPGGGTLRQATTRANGAAVVTVVTAVASRPPHRSRRALLTHRA